MSKIGAAVAAILSLSAMAVAVYAWIALGASEMTTTGYVALVLGGMATLALGAGLMGLIFYSNRKGFDDIAGAPPRLEEDAPRPEKLPICQPPLPDKG